MLENMKYIITCWCVPSFFISFVGRKFWISKSMATLLKANRTTSSHASLWMLYRWNK